MKEDIINNLVESALERLSSLEALTLEQAPDLCKELVAEEKTKIENEIIIAGLALLFSLIFLIGSGAAAYYFKEEALVFIAGCIGIISLMTVMVSVGCIVSEILSLRVLKAAPKPFIIKGLRGLIK